MQPKAVEGRNVLIERAFRSIVLHPELAPLGMDAKYWLDSFSTRQKLQWIEFAQKLARWKPAEADETHDKEILEVLNAFAVAADDEEGVH